jgi:hypothetical protein
MLFSLTEFIPAAKGSAMSAFLAGVGMVLFVFQKSFSSKENAGSVSETGTTLSLTHQKAPAIIVVVELVGGVVPFGSVVVTVVV